MRLEDDGYPAIEVYYDDAAGRTHTIWRRPHISGFFPELGLLLPGRPHIRSRPVPMIARSRQRVASLVSGKRWIAFVLGLLANLAILAVVVFVYLAIFSIVLRVEAVDVRIGGLLFGTYLVWGSLLFPAIFYLLILEFAVDGSPLVRRLWAIALSPICMVPLYIGALSNTHESLGRLLLEALSLPLA